MSSDEEVGERFEVSQYDIDNEFNPNRGRRKRTKDDALYGVFNEDINGPQKEQESPAKRNRMSQPMAFVSAKKATGNPAAANHSVDDAHGSSASAAGASDSDGNDDATNEAILERGGLGSSGRPSFGSSTGRPRFGMPGGDSGGGGGGGGLGFGLGFAPKATGGNGAGPAVGGATSVAEPVMTKAQVPIADPFAAAGARAAGAGAATSGKAAVGYSLPAANRTKDKKFGAWEKSTKGFGLKMLQKMGWKGAGLGVAEQGIVLPVKDAKINRSTKKMGLQDSGERTEQSKQDFGSKETEAMKKEEAFREQLAAWKAPLGGGAGQGKKSKKPKYKYATVEEIAERARGGGGGGGGGGNNAGDASSTIKTSTMKVVDMTGAQTRVFSGYDKIAGSGGGGGSGVGDDGESGQAAAGQLLLKGADGSVPMPELQNNINVLVSQAEGDISDISAKIAREKKRRQALSREHNHLKTRVAKEAGHIATLKDILAVVADCKERLASKTAPLGLAGCADTFARLRREHPNEYALYGLAGISGSIMFPMIKKEFDGWLPLRDPLGRLDFFKTCRMLLATDADDVQGGGAGSSGGGGGGSGSDASIFERMCWDIVMPRFRAGLLNDWDPKDAAPAVDLVQTWKAVLPPWVVDNLKAQLVLPRLSAAVDAWDPTTDAVPVHSWLHPWLHLLGDTLDTLYGPIRYKLSTCLQAWHPSDASAKAIIEPWRSVWSSDGLASFLQRSVQPKLAAVLRELPIDPSQQDIAPFRWVLAWRGLMAADTMVRLLDQHFFPKLLAVLCTWLSGTNPNFPEVARWYIGWKQELHVEIANHPNVKKNLNLALDFMSKALAGSAAVPQPAARGGGGAAVAVAAAAAAAAARTEGQTAAEAKLSQKQKRAAKKAAVASAAAAMAEAELLNPAQTVKDLVQQVADKVGVVYMPKGGMSDEGKKLFSFGSTLSLYIEQGVVFGRTSKADAFLPISLDELERRGLQ